MRLRPAECEVLFGVILSKTVFVFVFYFFAIYAMPDTQYDNIQFGTAGWSYNDWEGIVYDRKEHGLEILSGFLDCVEINNTFYRIPDERNAENWIERVQQRSGFTFLVKLWKGFTHEAVWKDEDKAHFSRVLGIMKDKARLGGTLAQFPFYFKRDEENEQRVRNIAESFGDFNVFFEFRDASWLDQGFLKTLEKWGGAFCNIDIPGGENTFNRTEEAQDGKGYLRLHGRNRKAWFSREAGRDEKYNYRYSEEEIERLVERIKGINNRAGRSFVVANNHYRGKAVVNAVELKVSVTGAKVSVPEQLTYEYPELKQYSDTQSLF